MDVTNAIMTRRSVRWYTCEPVPAPVVDDLLHSAIFAPSAHNRQPWRFAVLTDADTKRHLAKAMAARLRHDRLADGDALESVDTDAGRSAKRIVEAPVVIVVSATIASMDRYPDARRAEAERIAAIQSTAMATQNLLLAAHWRGLGACILCAPLFCPAEVIEALQLPADWMPQSLVTIGWPLRQGRERRRRPIDEVTLRIDAARPLYEVDV